MSTPRMPRPRGRSPIAARVSSSMPVVTNRSRYAPDGSRTPSAAYCAPVRPAAASTSFCSTASSESSWVSAIPASTSARVRSIPASTGLQLRAELSRAQHLRAQVGVRWDEISDDAEHDFRLVAQRAEDLVAFQEHLPERPRVHRKVALGVALLPQRCVRLLDGIHTAFLPEQVLVRRDDEVGGGHLTADVDATH